MPQATVELRKIVNWIVSPELNTEVPDDGAVVKFLEARGYVLNKDWTWRIPFNHEISDMEDLCLRYLIDEWDYGCLEDDTRTRSPA